MPNFGCVDQSLELNYGSDFLGAILGFCFKISVSWHPATQNPSRKKNGAS
jgi:hypothetical protein